MSRKIIRSLGLLIACGIAIIGAGCGKKSKTPAKEGYKLLWADEFDGDSSSGGYYSEFPEDDFKSDWETDSDWGGSNDDSWDSSYDSYDFDSGSDWDSDW